MDPIWVPIWTAPNAPEPVAGCREGERFTIDASVDAFIVATAERLGLSRAVHLTNWKMHAFNTLKFNNVSTTQMNCVVARQHQAEDPMTETKPKKKMGRPPKVDGERRSLQLRLRLLPSEKAELQKAAKRLGISVSTFIVSTALERARRGYPESD